MGDIVIGSGADVHFFSDEVDVGELCDDGREERGMRKEGKERSEGDESACKEGFQTNEEKAREVEEEIAKKDLGVRWYSGVFIYWAGKNTYFPLTSNKKWW